MAGVVTWVNKITHAEWPMKTEKYATALRDGLRWSQDIPGMGGSATQACAGAGEGGRGGGAPPVRVCHTDHTRLKTDNSWTPGCIVREEASFHPLPKSECIG